MSRSLSLARMAFEGANICLEDVILSELDSNPANAVDLLAALKHSSTTLFDLESDIDQVRNKMNDEHYEDLPPITNGTIGRHGIHLASLGAVSAGSWDKMWAVMHGKGFYAVLDHFEIRVENLKRLTEQLTAKVEALVDSTGNLSAVDILEQNRDGNFRLEFAQLYSAWAEFQQEFLASAMISTQTWYQHTRVGSLLPAPQATQAA